MATRRPLVLVSGVVQEMPTGDAVPVANGGTGATTAAAARTAIGVAQDGPRFRAYLPAQTIFLNNTVVTVPLSAETFDPSNAFDATTNYRFQPTVAGYYDLKWSIVMGGTGNVMTRSVGLLMKNGAERSRASFAAPTAYTQMGLQGGDVMFLNGTTDYVELAAYGTVSSGTPVLEGVLNSTSAQTFLAGHYIGP